MNAPCCASTSPAKPAHSWLQQFRTLLKPLNVCSAPTTTTFAAFRAADVCGTCAHDSANGAAASVAPEALAACLVVAVADAATRSTAAAAPARSQRRLCIDVSLRLIGAGSRFRPTAAPATPTPGGVPSRRTDDGALA